MVYHARSVLGVLDLDHEETDADCGEAQPRHNFAQPGATMLTAECQRLSATAIVKQTWNNELAER